MKRIVFGIAVVLTGAAQVFAAGSYQPGEVGSKFLLVPMSARAVALGGAFAAAQGDASGLDHNPAGLAHLKEFQFSVTHIVYPGGINYSAGSLATPTFHRTGGVFRYRSFFFGDEQRDGIGKKIGGQNIDIIDRDFTLGLYVLAGKHFSLGINGDFIDRTLYLYRDKTIALGTGFQVYTTDRRHVAGISVQHIGEGTKFIEATDPLPMVYRLGGAHVAAKWGQLFWELQKYLDNPGVSVSAGLEWNLTNYFCFRGGTGYNIDTYFAGGMGFHWRSYVLDYAIRPQSGAGILHNMTLTLKWDITEDDFDFGHWLDF